MNKQTNKLSCALGVHKLHAYIEDINTSGPFSPYFVIATCSICGYTTKYRGTTFEAAQVVRDQINTEGKLNE